MKLNDKIAIEAVNNADKRLKEIPSLDYAIAAIADYDNGLTTGFNDGASFAIDEMIRRTKSWFVWYRENFPDMDLDDCIEFYECIIKYWD